MLQLESLSAYVQYSQDRSQFLQYEQMTLMNY